MMVVIQVAFYLFLSTTDLILKCLRGERKSSLSLSQPSLRFCVCCDPDVKDRRAFTPIHCASQTGNVDVVEALLEGGSDANIRGYAGTTPLHVSVSVQQRSLQYFVHFRRQECSFCNNIVVFQLRNPPTSASLPCSRVQGYKLANQGCTMAESNQKHHTFCFQIDCAILSASLPC